MSSLFGATQSAPSLFGNLENKSAQQATNAFGKPADSSPFANLSSAQSATQPTKSLFGGLGAGASNLAQQQPATNSVFGNLPQTTQQTGAASGGLFGNLGANSAQQQQQKPVNNLFGGLNTIGTGQTQPNAGASSLFSNTTNLATQSQVGGQQAQPSVASSAPTALFQNLLERGKKRNADSNTNIQFGDLPSLQLGLSDIANKVRNLGASKGASRASRGADSKAHYLLAASGVPRASTLRDLDDFPTHFEAPVDAPPFTSFNTDIDAFVSNLQAKSNADLFREHMEQTKRDFDAFVEERFHMNLDEQRQRVYEHFGLAKSNDNSAENNYDPPSPARGSFGRSSRKSKGPEGFRSTASFGASTLSRSVLGGTTGRGSVRNTLFSDVPERSNGAAIGSTQEEPFVRAKQDRYAACVRNLNGARMQGRLYPIIQEFGKVETETGIDSPQHLIDAYKVLKEITKEHTDEQSSSSVDSVRERHYAREYLELSNPGRSSALRKQILIGSKTFLEKSFLKSVEDLVFDNPREANVGGVPSKINKIRGYIRIRIARRDLGPENDSFQLIDQDQCWVLIFYLLRGGLVQEAAQYVVEHDRGFKSIDRSFGQYISAYANDPERRLPSHLQQKIENEYSSKAAEVSIDPYRLACLKIIGRCNLSAKHLEGVNTGMDDWMWVVLSLAREVDRTEESAGASFNLEDAQALVDTIGQRHFSDTDDTATGYATFFLLQMLVGMFEKAVAWLQSYNYIAAAHFAIALDYYGLLRISDFDPSESRLLTYTTTQQPQLGFARILGYYTRDFRTASPEAATDYLTLIALNSDLPGSLGQSQISVCHEALKELVLETREFATLLGDIRFDGQRTIGAIEQRLPLIKPADEDEFMRSLIMQAAAVADDSGRVTDAALLYHLAGEYDNVILIINQALSEAISIERGRDGMQLQPLKPRKDNNNEHGDTEQRHTTSLSLTSVDDPVVLAKNMIGLYNLNALYFQKIRRINREACGILIRMSEIRPKVDNENWGDALGMIESLQLLPLDAGGNVSVIRSASQAFSSLPQTVARTIGNLLLWTIKCLGKERARIRDSAYQTQRPVADDLLVKAKDMMVFAGLIRYKLPPDVFEVLARSGQDIGVN